MSNPPENSPEQQRIIALEHELAELRAQQQNISATAPMHGEHHQARASLRLKDPDLFYGRTKDDVDRWLFQIEQYLRAAGENDDAYRVAYAASLLRGRALAWWEKMVKQNASTGIDESNCSWKQFVEGLKFTFTSPNKSQRARDRLDVLTQRTSAADYANRFDALVYEIEDMGDAEILNAFWRGLKSDIKTFITLGKRPDNYEALVARAIEVDELLFGNRSRFPIQMSGYGMQQPMNANRIQGPVPMQLGTLVNVGRHAASSLKGGPQPQAPIHREYKLQKLTPEEKERMTKEGRCFRCREKGHLSKDCPKGKQQ
jgi:Retrotransposon gag protein/Zinc knuckle